MRNQRRFFFMVATWHSFQEVQVHDGPNGFYSNKENWTGSFVSHVPFTRNFLKIHIRNSFLMRLTWFAELIRRNQMKGINLSVFLTITAGSPDSHCPLMSTVSVKMAWPLLVTRGLFRKTTTIRRTILLSFSPCTQTSLLFPAYVIEQIRTKT